jgi:hypothetical protein
MPHTSLSTVLTKLDSTPVTKANTLASGGVVRSAIGYVTMAATTAAQTYAFVRIPVRARIVSLHPSLVTSMGSGDLEFGLFRPDTNTLKAIDSDCLAAHWALTGTISGSSAMTAPGIVALTQSIADAYSTAITTAGATADAFVDIVASVVTVSTGAATAMALEVKYVLPE